MLEAAEQHLLDCLEADELEYVRDTTEDTGASLMVDGQDLSGRLGFDPYSALLVRSEDS